ncbi:fluoride efflux transporter CrcB [Patulibacter brassicae]|uniref:Fluoride-specific ion channel FluC n=1 Tax=Patulibacter brassicae TaxID=1705717 RepID=A0ABU4VPN0_9ACTN|nr:fluoride efflux transporter CrcB [Patulibacter brassicae]MDX8153808.1 fluoride efflux transporter CrcB [Patulibacter brassicae]
MSVLLWSGVAALGGAGAVLRFLVDARVRARVPGAFPAGILVVNVSASLALGLVSGLALSHDAALLLGTAFVGAYSTFSTWMLDVSGAARDRLLAVAAGNLVGSMVLGLAAAAAGRAIGLALA